MPFSFLPRKQFTFKTSHLNRILNEIADSKISITAFDIDQIKDNLVSMHLVVGLPSSIDNDHEWNRKIKNILRCNNLDYCTNEIIQISGIPSGESGVIRTIYNSLRNKVDIKTIYIGEDNHVFVESNNNEKVVKILKDA